MAKKQTSGNLALEQQRVIVIPAHDEIVARKLRVAAYARVSSSSEDQLNSYRVQNQYYSELISGNPDWEMVDIYADEGITGTSVEKREDFQRMMQDCRKGKIDRILVKSPAVATYDLQPEMSAYEVTDKMVEAVKSGKYDALILNYANCDMVGHTGVFNAAKRAVEAVDKCLGETVDAILRMGGRALITADHGNADRMVEPDGSPNTAHTTNPVPFVIVGTGELKLRTGGRLADIAPTLLELMGLPAPKEMTGVSLIEK